MLPASSQLRIIILCHSLIGISLPSLPWHYSIHVPVICVQPAGGGRFTTSNLHSDTDLPSKYRVFNI